MLVESKQIKGLKAIHDLLIIGRRLAFEGFKNDKIASFFDEIEYLPALILEQSDQTLMFEECLKAICEKYSCMDIIERYYNNTLC